MKLTKGETTTAGSLPHEEVITMTPTEKMLAEFDEVFYEIMGLETDPEGTPDMLLIRDEDDNVLNSISFTPEKEAIKSFLSTSITQAREEESVRVREEIEKMKKQTVFDWHIGYNEALDDLLSSLDKPLTDKE